MTRNSDSANVNGFLLLNKPTGLTSNRVLQQCKRLFSAKKAGHTGSLDPLATGMLPICFGEASKFSQYLLDADKCYQVTGMLGVTTSTADAQGEVLNRAAEVNVSRDALVQTLSQFKGQQLQIPHMFSALKHQGRPLYAYAREGIEIERKARAIMIHSLELLQFDGQYFDLRVHCSKGTYIRNLVEDIGLALGVGAHVTVLHRLYTAGFEQQPMYSMEAIASMSIAERLRCLLPLDIAVGHFPARILKDDEIRAIRQGKLIPAVSPDQSAAQLVRLYDNADHFLGLAEHKRDAYLKAKRLLAYARSDLIEKNA